MLTTGRLCGELRAVVTLIPEPSVAWNDATESDEATWLIHWNNHPKGHCSGGGLK